MFTSIFLQRRRIAFGMFFYFLAGLLDFGRFGGWEAPFYVITMSLVFAVICGAIMVVLVPLFPGFRQVVEIGALTFFLLRLSEVAGLAGFDLFILNGAWGVVLLCLVYVLLNHFVYGTWWRKTPVRLSWTGRSCATIAVAPETAWARLVPDEAHPDAYYSGILHEFRRVDDADFTHLMRTRLGGPSFVEQRIRVVRNIPYREFAYEFDADVSERNRALFSGEWSILLEPLGEERTRVEVVERVRSTTPADALLFFFDDLGGQVAVSMKRRLEGRRDPTMLGRLRRQVLAAA